MSVYLSGLAGAGWQFFDNSGNPLAGGLLYTYAAGTSTPQTTYTSSTGLVAQANPIILDAAGRVSNEIWLTAGVSYKFVLKDSSAVQIGVWDNIAGIVSAASVVSSFSGGTTGLTPNTSTQGDISLAGTLKPANGGTGIAVVGTAGNKLVSDGANFVSQQDAYQGVGTYTLASASASYAVGTTNLGSLFSPSLPGSWVVMGVGPVISSTDWYLLYRTS